MGKNQRVLIVLNFSDKQQTYNLEIKNAKLLKMLLASDNEIYGGCAKYQKGLTVKLIKGCCEIKINAFTGLMYEIKN